MLSANMNNSDDAKFVISSREYPKVNAAIIKLVNKNQITGCYNAYEKFKRGDASYIININTTDHPEKESQYENSTKTDKTDQSAENYSGQISLTVTVDADNTNINRNSYEIAGCQLDEIGTGRGNILIF